MLVGFDLDMTLLDTRPGIAATYRELSARTGVYVDADAAVARLGPPLAHELALWFPAADVPAAVTAYRSLYPDYAIGVSQPMPGAREAIAAVRSAGGRVIVVTGKHARLARLHLDHVGLYADDVFGGIWGAEKADHLEGALAYVGDHVADMVAARSSGAYAVAVATGSCGRDELRAAGADEILTDLTGFPDVLSQISVGAHRNG